MGFDKGFWPREIGNETKRERRESFGLVFVLKLNEWASALEAHFGLDLKSRREVHKEEEMIDLG